MRALSVVSLMLLVVFGSALSGCTHFTGSPGNVLPGDTACALLDSALASSGLRQPLAITGKVTIDVNQYRVRGRFGLRITEAHDLAFEMTSTTLLGGHREDAVLSFYADTLRVLDRERGRYYEGEEVNALVTDGTKVSLDLAELLHGVTARTPDCRRVTALRRKDDGDGGLRLQGLIDGREFEIRFERGRLTEARWPLPLRDRGRGDTVETRYTWVGNRLTAFVVHVPERRWRIKLRSIEYK